VACCWWRELFLRPFVCGFGGLGLLFDERGNMLLAEAEGATGGEQLGIGGWLATGIAASNVCFDSFHNEKTPEFLLCVRNGPSGPFSL
jgi:hypothetical protein